MLGSDLETTFNRTEVVLNKYTTPSIFKMGFSIVPYESKTKKLMASVELNHPSDNAENIRLGGEMSFRNILFTRIGYKINVLGQNYPTAGLEIGRASCRERV